MQFYFPALLNGKEKREADTKVRRLIERYVCHSHAVHGDGLMAVGWSVESDVPIMAGVRKVQAGPQQKGDQPTAAVYGVLVGWESEEAAGQWREGSDGVGFSAQVKGISGILASKLETVVLRRHHNLVRG